MEELLKQIETLESRLSWRKQFLDLYTQEAKYWYKHKKDLEEEIALLVDLISQANEELRRTIQR